nr:hypothetical protein [Tanacetum cinerariifolium]
VIREVVSCRVVDYPTIEVKEVKQLRFELQDTMGIRISITLWGPYAEQVNAALRDRTKMNHRIAPLVNYKRISFHDEFLTHLEKENLADIRDIRKVMSCVIVGTIKCVECETKWYYLECHACNFGVDTILKDYMDEETGVVKKKTIYTCKSKSCGDVTDVLYKFKIQIRVLDNTGSVSLTLFDQITNTLIDKDANKLVEKQKKFVNSIIKIHITTLSIDIPDSSASATRVTNSLIEYLKDTGTSPIKRKLEDVIDALITDRCHNGCIINGKTIMSRNIHTALGFVLPGNQSKSKGKRKISQDGNDIDTTYQTLVNFKTYRSNVTNHYFPTSSLMTKDANDNTSVSSRKHNLRSNKVLPSNIPLLDFYVSKDDDFEIGPRNPYVGVSKGRRTSDGRTYNLLTAFEIVVLIVGDIQEALDEKDIVVESKTGDIQQISVLHPKFLSLQYLLLFPYVEDGYHMEILHRDQAKNLCCEPYEKLSNQVANGNRDASTLGKIILLNSSFTGGARFMRQNYLNAMALCKWFGHPDFFITFTCNPKWPEISRFAHKRAMKLEDRPEVFCRMFKFKLDHLIKKLKENQMFSRVQAERIDDFISAEIPDKYLDLDLYTLMTKHMMHGPYGADNPSCPCTIKGEDGNFVEMNHVRLDNQFFVPYNSYLLKKYQAHINVEWCNQRILKYEVVYRIPAVERLPFHLPGQQQVVYDE